MAKKKGARVSPITADRLVKGWTGVIFATSKLGFFSAAEITARLGTSDATVVRTAQTLGYRGLADLKRTLLDDAPPPEPTPSARLGATLRHATTPTDVLDHALDTHQTALHAARDNLDERFPAAVALLAAADRPSA